MRKQGSWQQCRGGAIGLAALACDPGRPILDRRQTMNTPGPIVGTGRFRYQTLVSWPQLPAGWSFVEVVGVATDSRGRVFVFSRGEHPVTIFDRDGRLL